MSTLLNRLRRLRYMDGLTFQMICERVKDLKRPAADIKSGLFLLVHEDFLTAVTKEQSGASWTEFIRTQKPQRPRIVRSLTAEELKPSKEEQAHIHALFAWERASREIPFRVG